MGLKEQPRVAQFIDIKALNDRPFLFSFKNF